MFYCGDKADEYFQYDPVSGIIISTSNPNAITIKSGGDINIEAGGDINFVGSTYISTIDCNTAGDVISIMQYRRCW